MNGLRSTARNVAPYAVMLLIAGYFLHVARDIDFTQPHQLGPAFWPEAVLALMMITCSVAILAQIHRILWPRPRRIIRATAFAAEERELRLADIAKIDPWVAIALTSAYVYLFPRMGYFLATSLFVTAAIYLGNYRRLWIAVILGISTSIAFMVIFMKIVYVSLPIGMGPFADMSTFVMAALGIR